jgi:acetylglutamate kinase
MKTIVVKIGGSTIDTEGLLDELAVSVRASAAHRAVVVHGGGKDIGRQLDLLNKHYTFVEGLRVTDPETMRHVQMVLSGDVNKRIVNAMLLRGVPAAGISGVDLSLFEARRVRPGGVDIGQVGEIDRVNTRLVEVLLGAGAVPVVSPVSRNHDGEFFNVNADTAASDLALALSADHLIFVSDVPGVLDATGKVISEIPLDRIEEFVGAKVVTGGMIPKVRSAAEAVRRGVGAVHICGWHGPETIGRELEIATSSGTVVRRAAAQPPGSNQSP